MDPSDDEPSEMVEQVQEHTELLQDLHDSLLMIRKECND